MGVPPPLSTFYQLSYTFADDDARRVENNPEVVLSSVNIHVYGNDAAYGNSSGQNGIIRANAVVWFDAPCRPYDFIFKNNVAGANTQIVIIGTVMK